ncbi:MAG: hypothetical protein JW725_02565 [Candidatus Babeliaceae bacterium]|nr:hypothetical protein [Candidatus Babeliaceae bacterium]
MLSYRLGYKKTSSTCVSVGGALTYQGWHGSVHTFDIKSENFATVFMALNQSSLVNVTHEMMQLLERYQRKQSQKLSQQQNRLSIQNMGDEQHKVSSNSVPSKQSNSPAPQKNLHPVKDEEALLRWINKIESLKGPAARHAAVEAALKNAWSKEQRKRLLFEASRIEVNATLDKADSLKTKSAKRRVLQNALQEIQSDSVPDELQTQLITMLESELQNLENESE